MPIPTPRLHGVPGETSSDVDVCHVATCIEVKCVLPFAT